MSNQSSDLTPRSPGNLDEPIVALASVVGSGARAIIRLSGREVWPLVRQCMRVPSPVPDTMTRGRWQVLLELTELHAVLPAQLFLWPGPRSYTGQDLVELHTLSSPPLLDLLLTELHRQGARLARPGEFTQRAFLHGKLDLTQAEAVRSVIDADQPEALNAALRQLAGGIARPLQELRDRLLTLLADVEAGLDFADEDLTFVSRERLLATLGEVRAEVAHLQEQLRTRGQSGHCFRVVLTGLPNAGKSSLFNALVGRPAALVSAEPGTTRDYVSERMSWAGIQVELIDTAGAEPTASHDEARHGITAQSQEARREQTRRADLVLHCADDDFGEPASVEPDVPSVHVRTKVDLPRDAVPDADPVRTSAKTGEGIAELRRLIAERLASSPRVSASLPSLARCRHHVAACLEHLRHAESLAALAEPPELLALELRLALDQVGEMAGTVYTEDLLDRVFSQFCIGK